MQLAQLNVAKMLAPKGDPTMADFFDNIDRVNTLAEASKGFVWRLKDEGGDATEIAVFEDEMMLVNLSVWENMDCLFDFVYHTMHAQFVKRKKEWFERMGKAHTCLWYIENGVYPTESEAKARLEHLREHGASEYAFTFKERFDSK